MSKKVHFQADEETFKVLYNAYKNRLYGFVLAMVHHPDIAEELTQEIFVSLWLHRFKLEQVMHLESYIFSTARNKTLNYLRKAANDERLLKKLQSQMKTARNDVEEHIAMEEHHRLMEEALNLLSTQRRRVFILSRYEGMNLEEIAQQLQLSKNTIKNHLVTSLRIIRTYLSKHGMILPLLFVFLLQ